MKALRTLFGTAIVLLAATPASATSIQFQADSSVYNFGDFTAIQKVEDFPTNRTWSAASLASGNISMSASVSIGAGQLRAQNVGSLAAGAAANVLAIAAIRDTIRATGSTGGLNLGVNLRISGSSASTMMATNDNYFRVGIYRVGHADFIAGGGEYYDPAWFLWGTIYTLGTGTNRSPDLSYTQSPIAGHFNDGTNTLPLNIPYGVIGNNFEIVLALVSGQSGTAGINGASWANNFGNTIDFSLSGGNGVTLLSSSGVMPGAISANSPIPEPSTSVLLGVGMVLLAGLSRRKS